MGKDERQKQLSEVKWRLKELLLAESGIMIADGSHIIIPDIKRDIVVA